MVGVVTLAQKGEKLGLLKNTSLTEFGLTFLDLTLSCVNPSGLGLKTVNHYTFALVSLRVYF